MARLPCPFSYTEDPEVLQINNYSRYVDIRRGICDSPDICENPKCPFYDKSKDATKMFWESACHAQTLDGAFHSKDTDIEIYYTIIDQAGLKIPEKLG